MPARQSSTPGIWSSLLLLAAAGLVPAVLSTLMIVAALKMKRLGAYGLAITASILAIVSPACLIGLPIGIWAWSCCANETCGRRLRGKSPHEAPHRARSRTSRLASPSTVRIKDNAISCRPGA